eukprot:880033-Rhodomonas_salina.1
MSGAHPVSALPRGDAACPAPSWEVAVFITQVAGLAESAGEAVASGCLAYEIAGALVISFLLIMMASFFFLVRYGLRLRTEATWIYIPWREGWPEVKTAFSPAEPGEKIGWLKRFLMIFHALEHIIRRGEWEQKSVAPGQSDFVHGKFHDRWCALFDWYHGGAWWFGFWFMLRALAMGIVLSALRDSQINTIICLAVSSVDTGLRVLFHPDRDWVQLGSCLYTSLCNLVIMASVFAFIEGLLDEEWFSWFFQLVAMLSMFPLVIKAIFKPVADLFSMIFSLCSLNISVPVTQAMGEAAAGVGLAVIDSRAGEKALEDIEDGQQAVKDKMKGRRGSVG